MCACVSVCWLGMCLRVSMCSHMMEEGPHRPLTLLPMQHVQEVISVCGVLDELSYGSVCRCVCVCVCVCVARVPMGKG